MKEPTREEKLQIIMEAIELWDPSTAPTLEEAEAVLKEMEYRGWTWEDVQNMPEWKFNDLMEDVLV